MRIVKMINAWFPDYIAPSVQEIDFTTLYKQGVRCVAFDVDGTITKNGSKNIDKKHAQILLSKLDKSRIQKRFLASNSTRSFDKILQELPTFEVIQPITHKGKPSKEFYKELIRKSGCKPNQIAMIGDRAIQDIWAPNRQGIITVQIELSTHFAGTLDKLLGRHIWQKRLLRQKKNR